MTPNQQYKDLGPSDVIQEGDETLDFFTGQWRKVLGHEIGNKLSNFNLYKFRRPIPVQEVGAGKCEQTCSHDFYPQNGLCAYCGLSETDASICDLQRENDLIKDKERLLALCATLQRENEELRKSLHRTKKHLADANRGAERQQKVNMIHCDTINTLRARLDKAVKALEPFAAMKDKADAYIIGLRDSGEKTADFHLDAEVGKVTCAQAAIAQQTLTEINKGPCDE